jgi:hypothetical protein
MKGEREILRKKETEKQDRRKNFEGHACYVNIIILFVISWYVSSNINEASRDIYTLSL